MQFPSGNILARTLMFVYVFSCLTVRVPPHSGESSQMSSEGTKTAIKINKKDNGFLSRKEGHVLLQGLPMPPTKTSGSQNLQVPPTESGAGGRPGGNGGSVPGT